LKKAVMGFVLRKVKRMVPKMKTINVTMVSALEEGAAKRAAGGADVDNYRNGQTVDDVALYQYTGGTTGRSKGAELTHGNILINSAACKCMYVDEIGTREGDCLLVVLPLYHITAFVLNMLQGLLSGAHSIMVPNPRPISNLQKAFESHAVTHVSGINTMFAALLEEPWCTAELFRKLRYCGSGGAAQHVPVARRWEALTGVPIHEGYGLTECAGGLTVNPVGGIRLGYAGVPIPGMLVRIVDSDGNELPNGEAGEVCARGPVVMKGYLNQPEATAETIRDGWLHTGDIGVKDENGYIQIVDRKKDMILVSGFNVYPNEIEDVIAGLASVIEVGVIGVPDEKTGEAVKAFVVSSDPDLSASQVMVHCAASLTNYKRPKQVEFVDEIPKTPVGKVLRRSLREMGSA
jgi:long-chain acyl-CoA synthetase